MKKLLLLTLLIVLHSACTRHCDCTIKANRILLLKVDFLTYQFEGAFEQVLSSPFGNFDTIPISNDFTPPGDFGNLTMYYLPDSEVVFNGDIVWNGWGPINFPPVFEPASNFNRATNALSVPDSSRFQYLFHAIPPYKSPLDSIWMDIANLHILKEFNDGDKKIGYFLYTPSVGAGDPADWDWFVVLNSNH